MRLSEAIRLGGMLRPQARRMLKDGAGGVCAFGAAFDAVGVLGAALHDGYGNNDDEYCYEDARLRWPVLNEIVECPECGPSGHSNFIRTVWCLNDDKEWTREQIADWVESIEQQAVAQDSAIEMSADDPNGERVDTKQVLA